jgi:transcriptional regulator of acetoin/glycerol metabolism
VAQLPSELRLPSAVHGALAECGPELNLETQEKRAILQALKETHWNKKRAAGILGIQRVTLYAKLAKYGIASAEGA